MLTAHSDLAAYDGTIDRVLQALSTIISHGKSLPVSISRQISQCIDKLIEAKCNELLPGEMTEMVVGNIRFLCSAGFLSQAEAETYSAPQTLLEEFLRTPPRVMTFSQGAVPNSQRALVTSASSFKILHLARAMSGRKRSGLGSNDAGNGAVVQVSVFQSTVNYLPGRSPNTTAMEVTLSYDEDPGVNVVVLIIPNPVPILYFDIAPQNQSVSCQRNNRPYSVSANCSAFPNLNVTCPGNDTHTLRFVCPGKKLVPVCLAWNGVDYIASDACIVAAYTPYNITCVCVGNTGYNEALGEPATNNPQIDNIATSADVEIFGFERPWLSADDLSPESLTRNKVLAKIPPLKDKSFTNSHPLFLLRL